MSRFSMEFPFSVPFLPALAFSLVLSQAELLLLLPLLAAIKIFTAKQFFPGPVCCHGICRKSKLWLNIKNE